jgi:hypothetical protein
MKTIKRMILGVVSSLLFTAGFARAAQHVDPLTLSMNSDANAKAMHANCPSGFPTQPCLVFDK